MDPGTPAVDDYLGQIQSDLAARQQQVTQTAPPSAPVPTGADADATNNYLNLIQGDVRARSNNASAGLNIDPNDPAASMPYRLGAAAERGASAGLSDKAGAAIDATQRSSLGLMGKALDLLPDSFITATGGQPAADRAASQQEQLSWGDIYHADLDKERALTEQFGQEHPALAATAYGAGMLTTAPLMAAKTAVAAGLLPKVVQGAKTGAALGAASGFAGTNDTSLAEDALATGTGAAGGALTGGLLTVAGEKIVAPVAGMLLQKFLPSYADKEGARRISEAIAQDAAGSYNPATKSIGVPLDEYVAGLKAKLAAAGDQPLTLADVGGENLRGILGTAMRQPGAAKQFGTEFLDTRDAGAGPRLTKVTNDLISNGGDAYSTREALDTARAAQSAPLYDAARQIQGVWSPRLKQFLDDPVMKAGLAKGMELERIESVTNNRPFNPSTYGVDLDQQGNVALRTVPNMSLLDAGKKGLDALIADERNAVTGKLSQRGKAINDFRVAYLNELDNLDPTAVRDAAANVVQPGVYAQARAAYSGPSQSLDAMNAGQGFLAKEPAEVRAELAKLAPGDRDFYLLGAAQSLRNKIANVGESGNEGAVLAGKQLIRDRLRPLFQDDASYNQFMQSAQTESQMAKTRYQLTGNSKTAERQASDAAAHGEGGAGQAFAGAGLMLAGEPVAGSYMAARGGMKVLNDLRQLNPQSNLSVVRRAFGTTPEEKAQVLADILQNGTRRSIMPQAGTIALAPQVGQDPSSLLLPMLLMRGAGQSQVSGGSPP